MVNFMLARVAALLRPRPADLLERRLIGGGERQSRVGKSRDKKSAPERD
jgi:hypothetical protein